jgi:hypothetical protein
MIQVDFPVSAPAGTARRFEVARWLPPAEHGPVRADAALLKLSDGPLIPKDDVASLKDASDHHDIEIELFGYPESRAEAGVWSRVTLRRAVSGGLVQLDMDRSASVIVQPGFSGTPLIVTPTGADAVIGMLVMAPRGGAALDSYALPIDTLARQWPELEVEPLRLGPPPNYEAVVAELWSGELLERERDLDVFDRFLAGSKPYLWWMGKAWTGKTTLAAHLAQLRRPQLDVVSFFILRRRAEADSVRFLQALSEQIAYLVGVPAPVTADRATFVSLWQAAEQRATARERQLLLVVDGLDEDDSFKLRLPSIAQCLPSPRNGVSKVVVTSRPFPDIPADVPVDHPLCQTAPLELSQSPHAKRQRDLAEQEMKRLVPLIADNEVVWTGLGLLTVAASPLTVDDLTRALKVTSPTVRQLRVGTLLEQDLGNILKPAGKGRYELGHEAVREAAAAHFSVEEQEELCASFVKAAQHLSEAGWPIDATSFFANDYPVMLARLAPEELSCLWTDYMYLDAVAELRGEAAVAELVGRTVAVRPQDASTGVLLNLLHTQFEYLDVLRESTVDLYLTSDDGKFQARPGLVTRRVLLLGEAEEARQLIASAPRPLVRELQLQRGVVAAAEPEMSCAAIAVPHHLILCGRADGTICAWDYESRTARRLAAHLGGVSQIRVSGDGRRAVSGGLIDGRCLLWDLDTLTIAGELGPHWCGVQSVAIDQSGTRVLSSDQSGQVHLWDVDSSRLIRSTAGDGRRCSDLSISPGGNYAARQSRTSGTVLWSTHDPTESHALEPDGRLIAIDDDGGSVVVSRTELIVRQPDTTFAVAVPQRFAMTCGFVSPDQRIAVLGWYGSVGVFDLRDRRCIHRAALGWYPWAMAEIDDGELLGVVGPGALFQVSFG